MNVDINTFKVTVTPTFSGSERGVVTMPPRGDTAWVIRLYEAADEVFRAVRLNLLWLAAALLGGVLLGGRPGHRRGVRRGPPARPG
jgi:hypothetical protein